ncbi:hypothetical protein CALCODRAFT_508450 [Calocera cornea HHB12733]|uniref:Uncharacterized protein n=1 Tax=Calocera cornea HHB12733 TaxID=1353952 RepID=A0A165GG72_9BASI|nr:hypothetical protein CALCODRAFT_508450 [Calocera cornea HHB12733]
MQEWERLLDKAKSGQHTGVDDPRYTKAIFVWVLNSLKYPIEKAAFCVQQNMRLVDLTNILQSLDSRCFARKAALEKKTELHYHGSSPDDQEPALTPTKSLKRKASTIDMADGIGSRPEEQDLSPTKRLTRSVTRPQITPTKPIAFTPDHARSAQSARSGRSSNPFRPSPTKARGRPVSPEHLPATPSDSEKDGDDGRYSPPPPPRYRLRPLFLETLGLSKKDNLREVEWFRNWRAQVIKRGFESESEDEIEEFDEDEENPDGGRNGITNSDQSEDGETYG